MKKIVLTGGGTGGHIFPLVAVAEEIQKQSSEVQLHYIGPNHPLNVEFTKRNIETLSIVSSKLRRYFDWRNFTDIFKFLWSIFQSLAHIFYIQPDLVFSKGGPGALPVVLAARCFFVPVVIHDSDAVPGLTNRLSAIFAKKIFIAWKNAEKYFPKNKTELIGNPIRADLLKDSTKPQHSSILQNVRVSILVLGGSQGAACINSFISAHLKELLKLGSILHQTGENNVGAIINYSASKNYHPVKFLDAAELKRALSKTNLVISRAGASAIFEIAAFGKPSILIPLEGAASNHQKANAYEYAATGAAVVVEESDLNWQTMKTEIEKILKNGKIAKAMAKAAKSFSKHEAAEKIAKKLLNFGGLTS
ncbi:MAG TPA: undecaprenyldiphospho-muramoylpentapeptide beta-N-acetylglucosaminyltransferase [Candidatus Paceibacterota bacterium]|nr:undecaprenyldiphospho-muramoylpentapeptide beta-N-acetylglucosaminyltransferase [Candidatus Paceibacterota bacterium]